MSDNPTTLQEATLYFSDADRCEEYMRQIRWGDKVPVCPKCGAKGQRIGEIKTRRMLKCKDCKKQFSSRVGTVFESSKIGLDKWFLAVWLIANCKNGISSYELSRDIGVEQKTAWFILHRIRAAMEVTGPAGFDGPSEADATYVGGKARNMHASRRERIIKGRGAVVFSPAKTMLVSWASNRSFVMADKPQGWNAFNSLARRISQAPKEAVDKQFAANKKARKKQLRKK